MIVVSGDTFIDSAIQALKAGAYDFLRKPYEPENWSRACAMPPGS